MTRPTDRRFEVGAAFATMLGLLGVPACGSKAEPPPAEHAGEGDKGHGGRHEGEDHEGEVHERARIEVSPVTSRVLAGDARIPAEVQLVPQRTAHVAPLSPGRLVRVDAQPGQAVKAGQVLAVVSSAEVATLAAKGDQLRVQLGSARSALERQKTLAAEGIASQRALVEAESVVRQLQAEAAGVQRKLELVGAKNGKPELELVSPIDGIVVAMHATLGEMTRNDEPPFVV